MTRAEREKGARGELEVVQLIQRRWPRATRNFGSGSQGNGDIAHGPPGISWEVKRTERLRLRDAWKQAVLAANGDTPVIAHRWNGGPWLGVLDLNDLLPMLEHEQRIRSLEQTMDRYRAGLAQIADQESGVWGQVAMRALRGTES